MGDVCFINTIQLHLLIRLLFLQDSNILKNIQLICNNYYPNLFLEIRPLYQNLIEFDVIIFRSHFSSNALN